MYVDNTLTVSGPPAAVDQLVALLDAPSSVFAIAAPMGLSELNDSEYTNPEWPDMPNATRTVEKRGEASTATWTFQTDMSPLKGLTSWVARHHPTLKVTHRYAAPMDHVWGVFRLAPDGPHPGHHAEHHAYCPVTFWDPDEHDAEQFDASVHGRVLDGRDLEIALDLPEHDSRVEELLNLGYELTLTEAEPGEFPFRTALKLKTEVVMERILREGHVDGVNTVLANVFAWDHSSFEVLRESLLEDNKIDSMKPVAQEACLATLAAMWANTDLKPATAWARETRRRGIAVRTLMPVLGMTESPYPSGGEDEGVDVESVEDRYAALDGLLV